MAAIGYGYGSECHLLRWMGRHRQAFNKAVANAIGKPGARLDWEDFGFDPTKLWADQECVGLDFLKNADLQGLWKERWPCGRGINGRHNWDAVGSWMDGSDSGRVLLEAKAHLGELRSDCRAKNPRSLERIEESFQAAAIDLGLYRHTDRWLWGYYQTANRLAALKFLHRFAPELQTHLVFLYFVGDVGNSRRIAPQEPEESEDALNNQYDLLGIRQDRLLPNSIHSLFLHVSQPRAWLSPKGISINLDEPVRRDA